MPVATGLNSAFTFNTLVASPCNGFAGSVSREVVSVPGRVYNPLYIFGPPGSGKTHLLHAIGNAVLTTHPALRVRVVTAECFFLELQDAKRRGEEESFRRTYRMETDVLLLDDVDFIAGRPEAEDEVFHLFNTLREHGRQFVAVGKRFPSDIPGLVDRVATRLRWGLVAHLDPLDTEVKQEILHRLEEKEGISLLPTVRTVLLRESKADMRLLGGMFSRLVALARHSGDALTVEFVEKQLGVPSDPSSIPPEVIQEGVAKFFGVSPMDLRGPCRVRTLVEPRHVAMWLMRNATTLSLVEIGWSFQRRDHTTVLSGIRKINQRLRDDVSLRSQIAALIELLNLPIKLERPNAPAP